MLCLRCVRGLTSSSTVSKTVPLARKAIVKIPKNRTFTSFSSSTRTLFVTGTRPSLPASFTPSSSSAADTPFDLLPKISMHPALATTQVRCGPRDTFSPSHFVRKRRHGFLSRVRTRKGRMILKRRKAKGRSTLSH